MSSREAEFYAVVRCVCELFGLQGLLRDLGMPLSVWCSTDSSAWKIEDFKTQMLCVQDEVNREMVQINRINKPADLLTKYVSGERIKILLAYLDMTKETPVGSSATGSVIRSGWLQRNSGSWGQQSASSLSDWSGGNERIPEDEDDDRMEGGTRIPIGCDRMSFWEDTGG